MENDRELQSLAQEVLAPMRQWENRCHEASVKLVASGVIKGLRVARGSCRLVPSQHSWAVLGNPYDKGALILDPTLWSHTRVSPEVFVGTGKKWGHKPHGSGSIFEFGRPPLPTGKIVKLAPPKEGWSTAAKGFLAVIGPLDFEGWSVLAHCPVGGWPSKEILGQLRKHPQLGNFIPIDIVGMLLEDTCGDLYPRS